MSSTFLCRPFVCQDLYKWLLYRYLLFLLTALSILKARDVFSCGSLLLLRVNYQIVSHCSLNWQHQLCKNPRPNPDIKTLFTDHTCSSSNGSHAPPPANNPLGGPVPKPGAFPPLAAHSVSQFLIFWILRFYISFFLLTWWNCPVAAIPACCFAFSECHSRVDV